MNPTSHTSPLVYISILNWNGYALTIECLKSLEVLNYPNYRVIVVDNHSVDNSVEMIQKAFPDIHLIESSSNLGFAGGHEL